MDSLQIKGGAWQERGRGGGGDVFEGWADTPMDTMTLRNLRVLIVK